MSVLLACVFVHHSGSVPLETIGSPGTGVTYGCEPQHECLESNPDPLKEQQVLLTTGSSLHPHVCLLLYIVNIFILAVFVTNIHSVFLHVSS